MEEKKEKKKLNKKPLLICLAIALVFAIIGIVDIKSNAAEVTSYTAEITGGLMEYRTDGTSGWWSNSGGTWILTSDSPMYGFYNNTYDVPTNASGQDGNWWVISKSPIYGYKEDSVSVGVNGEVWYLVGYCPNWGMSSDGSTRHVVFNGTGLTVKHIPNIYSGGIREVIAAYMDGSLETIIDYSTLPVNDEMPIIKNLYFDKIENNGADNSKTITDYIRFDSNPNYKLVIMLCPSIYSTIGDSTYSSRFELYQYEKWVHMATSEVGLKEISCELGQFKIPINNVGCVITSNYKGYYEEICNELTESGQLVFKPTMGYRLAYFDEENELLGPSTYIIPNYYDNFNPDEESYSYFTLYSDGTRGTEKVMNLKTWEQEIGSSIDDVKEVIGKVEETLKDYVVIENDFGVQETTGWLYSVVNFIKGTPQLVGTVLGFLPQPILYGMYVCIFLGVIASGLAIVKALL